MKSTCGCGGDHKVECSPVTIDGVTLKPYEYGSDEYGEALNLRYRVLREPLGLEFSQQDLARELDETHFGAFIDGRLVGTLYLSEISKATVRMRQVAVDPTIQGKGIGKKLVRYAEDYAKSCHYSEMILTARMTAFQFYISLGYEAIGDITTEVTLPHQKMRKTL